MTEKNKKLMMYSNFKTLPETIPVPLMAELNRENQLIHRGIFSNDMSEYYYTVSDTGFTKFDVKHVKLENDSPVNSQNAFFNSEYNEHGMSFSPDGKTLFFSSTRPVDCEGVEDTWHIWKSEKLADSWSTPQFVDIPNLRGKLLSHPSVTNDGTLYFHASDLDYSNMDIYCSYYKDGCYSDAKKVKIPGTGVCKCTPYISPDQKYLIYAAIKDQLDLYICSRKEHNKWSEPKLLPSEINQNGQGNPVYTPDLQFLLYAKMVSNDSWGIYWTPTKTFFKNVNVLTFF